MGDLQLLIQWENYKCQNTKQSLEKFLEPFFIHFASLLEQQSFNSILVGPCLSDLPPEVLYVLTSRLQLLRQAKELEASLARAHELLLIKFIYLLSRNADNHEALSKGALVKCLMTACLEEMKKMRDPEDGCDQQVTTGYRLPLLNFTILTLESLLDPQLKWRAWKKCIYNYKEGPLEGEISLFTKSSKCPTPFPASEETVLWFYDALQASQGDRQVRERVLHCFCAAISGNSRNAQLLITPATTDALQVSASDSCATTEVLIASAYVLSRLCAQVPVHERQEDISLLCERFLMMVRRKTHLNRHECLCMHQVLVECPELSHVLLCRGVLPLLFTHLFNTLTNSEDEEQNEVEKRQSIPTTEDVPSWESHEEAVLLLRCLAWLSCVSPLSAGVVGPDSNVFWKEDLNEDVAPEGGRAMRPEEFNRRQQFVALGGYSMLEERLVAATPGLGLARLSRLVELILAWALGLSLPIPSNILTVLWCDPFSKTSPEKSSNWSVWIVDPEVLRCLLLWAGRHLITSSEGFSQMVALQLLTFLGHLCRCSRSNLNLCTSHALLSVLLSEWLRPLTEKCCEDARVQSNLVKMCLEVALLLGRHSVTPQDLFALLALMRFREDAPNRIEDQQSRINGELLRMFAQMARPSMQRTASHWLEMRSRQEGILLCPASFTFLCQASNPLTPAGGKPVVASEVLSEIDSRMLSATLQSVDAQLLNSSSGGGTTSSSSLPGFTLQFWLSLDKLEPRPMRSSVPSSASPSTSTHIPLRRRMLFRWLTRSGHGVEVFFTREGDLLVASVVAGEYHCVQVKCPSLVSPALGRHQISQRTSNTTGDTSNERHWQLLHLVWNNATGWFGQPTLQVYLNGEMRFQVQMRFPKLNDCLILCHVGGCPSNVEQECISRILKVTGGPELRTRRARLWPPVVPGGGSGGLSASTSLLNPAAPGVVQKLYLGQESDLWGSSGALHGQVMSVAAFGEALNETQVSALASRGIHDMYSLLLSPEEQVVSSPQSGTIATANNSLLMGGNPYSWRLLFYYHAKAWSPGCLLDLAPSVTGLSARFGQWCGGGGGTAGVIGGTVPLPAVLTARRLAATHLPEMVQRLGGIRLLLPMLRQVAHLAPCHGTPRHASTSGLDFTSQQHSLQPFTGGNEEAFSRESRGDSFSVEEDDESVPDGLSSFLEIVRHLLLSPATQQQLLDNKNVPLLGYLMEQVDVGRFTPAVVSSVRALVDSVGLVRTKHKLHRHLLWRWSLWSSCSVDVRTMHLKYVAGVLKLERAFFREKLGVKGILDAVRLYYAPPPEPQDDDECRPLREILFTMLRSMIAKHFIHQDMLDLLVFLHTCEHDLLLQELLDVLTSMFEQASVGDQVTLLMYEQDLCETLYCLLTRDHVSIRTKEKTISLLWILMTSSRVPMRHKCHILLDQRGGFGALFAHEHFHVHHLGSEALLRIIELAKFKAATDPGDLLHVLAFLSVSPVSQRLTAARALHVTLALRNAEKRSSTSPSSPASRKLSGVNPQLAALIFPQPAWYDALCHFFIKAKRGPNIARKGTANDSGFLPRSSSVAVRLSSRLVVVDGGGTDSEESWSAAPLTEEPEDVSTESVLDPDYVEREACEAEEMCSVLCQCLGFVLWWGGVAGLPSYTSSGPPSAWQIRNEVFQCLEDISQRYVLWKPIYWIYQELLKCMLDALMEQMQTSDAVSLTKDATQLVFMVRSLFCEERLHQDSPTDVTLVERCFRLLRDYLRVWDVSLQWSELSAVGLQLILNWCNPRAHSEEVHSCACARLHDLLNTQSTHGLDGSLVSNETSGAALTSYDEVAYVLMRLHDHIGEQLTHMRSTDTEDGGEESAVIGYYFLIPIMKTLLARYGDILQLQQFTPNMPSPRGLQFNEQFKEYSVTSEWRQFIDHKVRDAVEVYVCQNLAQVSRDLSLLRAQANEGMLQARNQRRRHLLRVARVFDEELFEKLVHPWTQKEMLRRERDALVRAHKQEAVANSAMQLCDNWPFGPSLPEHWMLCPLENMSRMRPKLEPNPHWRDHAEASVLRDYPSQLLQTSTSAEPSKALLQEEMPVTDGTSSEPLQHLLPSHVARRQVSDLEEDHLNDEDWSKLQLQIDQQTQPEIANDRDSKPCTPRGKDGSSTSSVISPSPSVSTANMFSSLPSTASVSGLSSLEAGGAEVSLRPLISVACQLVTMMQIVSGRLEISNNQLTFYDTTSNEEEADESRLHGSAPGLERIRHDFKCPLVNLREIHLRRYNLRRSAIEIFLVDQRNFLFNFDVKNRDRVYSCILGLRLPNLVHSKSRSPADILKTSQLTERWVRHEITNFDYLMQLNTIAGRTFNDLSQYPVFPWVLADYTSSELDFNNPETFRDLTKPIGVVNSKNEQEVEEKYESFEDPEGNIDKFHYGTHYSSAAGVMHYMVRMEPFTTLHIHLQSGKFDVADRQFYSIPSAWQFILDNPNDNKELIPEFFYLPEFLINMNNFNLGRLQFTHTPVDNVELPPWAHGSPHTFIYWHRQALECDWVSERLHHWIDLIFGYQQKGPEAVKALNVFYYVTYEGAVDLDSVEDPVERRCLESMIANFGQTPCQLLKDPHPRRLTREEYMGLLKRQDRLPNLLQQLEESPQLQIRCQTMMASSNAAQDPLIFVAIPSGARPGQLLTIQDKSQLLVGVSSQLQLSRNSWIRIPNGGGYTYESDTSNTLLAGRKRNCLGVLDPELRAQMSPFLGPARPSNLPSSTENVSFATVATSSCSPATAGLLFPCHQLISVSRDCRWLLCGGQWDNSVVVFNLTRGRVEHRVASSSAVLTCLHMSHSSTTTVHFITGARDGSCTVWKWRPTVSLALSVGESGAGGPPRVIHSWPSARVRYHSLTASISVEDLALRAVALHWELDVAVTADVAGALAVYSVAAQRLLHLVELPSCAQLVSLVMEPELAQFQAVWLKRGTSSAESQWQCNTSLYVSLFDVNAQPIHETDMSHSMGASMSHPMCVTCVQWYGVHLVLGTSSGEVLVCHAYLHRVLRRVALHHTVLHLALSSDQSHIIVSLADGKLLSLTI